MSENIFKDDILPPESPTAKAAWGTTDPFVVLSGGRNKGKSFLILQRQFTTCLHFEGIQSAIVRPTQRSIKSTIIPQIDNMLLQYPLSSKKNPWTYNKSEMKIYFDNGSELGFYGMDDAGKFLGGTYHFVFYSQIEQEKNPDAISHVLAGMGGYRAGEKLLDRNGKPYRIFIADANPGPPTHFLKQWEKAGKAKFFNFTHKDHPGLYSWDKQEWTPKGIITRDDLHRDYPEGYIRQKWVEGEWLGDFGLVYDMASNTYLIDELPDISTWQKYRSVDFGVHRFICLWIAKNPNEEEYIIYREYRRSGQTDETHALDILELSKEEHIEFTVGDHDRKGWDVFEEHGISCVPWKKGPDSVAKGVNLCFTALASGKLKIWAGYNSVSGPGKGIDKYFTENYLPTNLREEMLVYRYKPEEKRTGSEKDHEPWKEGKEDACDAMRGFAEEVFDDSSYLPDFTMAIEKKQKGRII